jgi:hypothetical protein
VDLRRVYPGRHGRIDVEPVRLRGRRVSFT